MQRGNASSHKQGRAARSAMAGMDVQSIVHMIIIVFIIFGNAMYFLMKKQEKER